MQSLSNRQLRHIAELQFRIILTLLARMDTIEAEANAELDRLRQAQVEHDCRIMEEQGRVWQENTQILWEEKEELQEKLAKAKAKRKESREWSKQGAK